MSISYSDRSLEALRSLIEIVERELATTAPPSTELKAAWSQVVKVLSLGPAPRTRTCPQCGEIGMRAASRCGRCWSTLALLEADDAPVARVE